MDHLLKLFQKSTGLVSAPFDLPELLFPEAGQFGAFQQFFLYRADEFHSGGRREEVLAFLTDIIAFEQRLDDGGSGGRTAYAVFLQSVSQFVVVHQFAGGFHCAEQCRFGVGFGRLCPFFT